MIAAAQPATLRMGTAQGRWVLFATVLGSGLAMLDATVVNVALERIGTELDAGFSGLQWTINAYTLTLAALILLGGSLGDRFGRRRVFVIGYAALGVLFVLLVLHLQVVAGFSPLLAGSALLPLTVIMLVFSARVGAGASYALDVLPAVTVFGAGLALTVAPLAATVLDSAADRYAGVASGVNNAVARAAGLLAVAVVPVVAGIGGDDYTDPLAFGSSFRIALLIVAALLVAGALVALS